MAFPCLKIWAENEQNRGKNEAESRTHFYFPMLLSCLSPPSVHQLQLTGGEREDPADVVGDPQGEEGDDDEQQEDPPESQILHELLPSGPEAGQDALAALQVGVEQRVALHGAGGDNQAERLSMLPPFSIYYTHTQKKNPWLVLPHRLTSHCRPSASSPVWSGVLYWSLLLPAPPGLPADGWRLYWRHVSLPTPEALSRCGCYDTGPMVWHHQCVTTVIQITICFIHQFFKIVFIDWKRHVSYQMSILSPLDTRNCMVSTWPHRCSAVLPW